MYKKFTEEFVSYHNKKPYKLLIENKVGSKIKSGRLLNTEGKSKNDIPIINFIPRFVAKEDYTDTFGYQWNIFKKTQLDSVNRTTLSRDRFIACTRWKLQEMKGQKILEAGCGAGRFTEIMLENGAFVYAFDYSMAAEACYENNQSKRTCIFQADIYKIPFAENYFDKILCYGVLQHTPNPREAFKSLLKHLKPGGKISIDCYLKDGRIQHWKSKYIWRPITTRMNKKYLLKTLRFYIPVWLPFDTVIKRVPYFGRFLGAIIPCWNYFGSIKGYKNLVEWAIMDTFDALSPKYDLPQTKEEITKWFKESPCPLKDINVFLGGNGIVGNATKQ